MIYCRVVGEGKMRTQTRRMKMKYYMLNLTQHPATKEQESAGVIEPADKAAVRALLTFATLPNAADIAAAACNLAIVARDSGYETAMIGGAPYLMRPLEEALQQEGINPVYAYSRRESVETTDADGNIRKTQTFRHLGFVGAS